MPESPSVDERCAAALQHQVAGRLELAERLYRDVLVAEPQHAAANYGLGMLLIQSQRAESALDYLVSALNANPEVADYWLGYLEALLVLRRCAEAGEVLQLARTHGLGGTAVEEFAARLSRASEPATPDVSAAVTPTRAERRRTQREARQQLRRDETALLALVKDLQIDAALAAARSMTERHPEHGVGWKVLGAMLWARGAFEESYAALRTSVRLMPGDAEAHCNLGIVLNHAKLLDEAEQCLKAARRLAPKLVTPHARLGDNYQMQGRYAEARASFQRALELAGDEFSPTTHAMHTGLLFTLNHDPTIKAQALFAEHRRAGAYLERHAGTGPWRHANAPDPERRLRIGFVSGDLRNHAVASFIEPLLEQWRDHPRLHVSIYYTHETIDDTSLRLHKLVHAWHAVEALTDAALAAKIAAEGIDVLIDLAGYTTDNRLLAFAHKPAPVQASWLGYPATTGLRAMDYYLTDRHFFPPGQFDAWFTEKLVYLPAVWDFRPWPAAPPVSPLPALTSGHLTFGSFNRLGKMNTATIALWSQVLRALPASQMVMAGIPPERQREQLIAWFAAEGVARERLSFYPWTNQETHLLHHQGVDMALESFPYTGCTTSNHALWMGVPTLTLVGDTPASRLSAANLGALGLEEFVAATPEAFLAKALAWSQDLPRLAALRAGMRARWAASPGRQAPYMADGLERALRQMWRRWCAGLPAESFHVMPPDPQPATQAAPAAV